MRSQSQIPDELQRRQLEQACPACGRWEAAATLAAIAATIARPADGSAACAVVEGGRFRAAWARDFGRRKEPVGPAFERPEDAARLADLLNGLVRE